MKRLRISTQVSIRILVFLLLAGCSTHGTQIPSISTMTMIPATQTPSLLGASGPPMVTVSTSVGDIKIEDFYIIEESDLDTILSGKKTIPAIFSSGTTRLSVVVVICTPLENGTDINVKIIGNDGPLELDDLVTFISLSNPEGCLIVTRDLKPVSGKYADGPYQAQLSINDIVVALLNWTVGSP